MQPPPNERELIEHAQNGDQNAVSTLYETYAHSVFAFIAYRVGSGATAEDLTADVFLSMVRSLPKFQYTGAPFGAWLLRIAMNRVTDFYREKRPQTSDAILENYRSDSPDPDEEVVKAEERSRLREALSALSEDYQTILILRFTQDLTHDEVAAVMGKSNAAVRVLQHRALKALAGILKELDDEERSE